MTHGAACRGGSCVRHGGFDDGGIVSSAMNTACGLMGNFLVSLLAHDRPDFRIAATRRATATDMTVAIVIVVATTHTSTRVQAGWTRHAHHPR